MFKYRQEQKQKMTQHILSQEFSTDVVGSERLDPADLAVVRSGHSACYAFTARVRLRTVLKIYTYLNIH